MSIPVRAGKVVTNIAMQVLIEVTGVPVQAPGLVVPSGCTVYVRGVNGTDAGNTKPIRVGPDRDAVARGAAQVVNPNTQVPFPCSNTAEIFISGAADDGASILIVG